MDYKIFSSNRSILQSSAIHPIIATADKSGHFVPVGVTSAFVSTYLLKNIELKIPTPKSLKLHFFPKKYMKIPPLEKKNQFQNSIFSILTKNPLFHIWLQQVRYFSHSRHKVTLWFCASSILAWFIKSAKFSKINAFPCRKK